MMLHYPHTLPVHNRLYSQARRHEIEPGGLGVEFTDMGPTMVGQRARIFLIRPRLAKKVSPELKINRVGGLAPPPQWRRT